jgi:hypothetical protein
MHSGRQYLRSESKIYCLLAVLHDYSKFITILAVCLLIASDEAGRTQQWFHEFRQSDFALLGLITDMA